MNGGLRNDNRIHVECPDTAADTAEETPDRPDGRIQCRQKHAGEPSDAGRAFSGAGDGNAAAPARKPSSLRALANGGEIQEPTQTWKYLQKRFSNHLGYVMDEMNKAASRASKQGTDLAALASSAYAYYAHIRPEIPHGTKGWGAHGRLETSKLSDFFT